MVIVLVRPSPRYIPGTLLLIPRSEVFQFRIALSDIAFNEVAVLKGSDLNVRIRSEGCSGYTF